MLAASGISIPFLLRTMLRMWETKTNSEALLALATTLDSNVVRSVIKVFSRSLAENRKW